MHTLLSIAEVAMKLGRSVPETKKLLQRYGISGKKIRGQTKFFRMQIIQWIEKVFSDLSEESLKKLDFGSSLYLGTKPDTLLITPLLEYGNIYPCVRANTKPSLIRKLVEYAMDTGLVFDREILLELIQLREILSSTAMPNGVAIPHPESIQNLFLQDDILILAKTAHPIPYGEESGKLTWLFFLLLITEPTKHLQMLARIGRILKSAEVIEELRECNNEDAILRVINCCEKRIVESNI